MKNINNQETQNLLDEICLYHIKLLKKNNGLTLYKSSRKSLFNKIKNKLGYIQAVIMLEELNKRFMELYSSSIVNNWVKKAKKDTFFTKLFINFLKDVDNNNLSLKILKNTCNDEDDFCRRGEFNSYKNEISLQILSPFETIVILLHELTHYYDIELRDVRYNLQEIELEINNYQENHKTWTNHQKNYFGRYWFIQSAYLDYYKEIMPRINSCLIFKYSYQNKLFNSISQYLKKKYKKIINGRINCHNLIQEELQEELIFHPIFEWESTSWQGKLINNYRKLWLTKNGFRNFIFKE